MERRFLVARNPDTESTLPYLLWVPVDDGLILKARERWPVSSRVYCHPYRDDWPEDCEVLEDVPVRACRRRGSAVDLVLDRARNNRAQFVFTEVRRRPAIFWQTARVAKKARPGVRVPTRRASGLTQWVIEVDDRERYPYKFSGRGVQTERTRLDAGDYGVRWGDEVVAAVERKTLEDLARALSDGSLGFAMAELATLPAGAVVVEGRYSALFKVEHVQPGWLPELAARLQVRYPGVPIVFCETRGLAEEWTYRFLGAALSELGGDTAEG
ncbi:MAG: ERCC4 domain-containing protein [Actinomycetota bacterium]|nr:ERCC4 domain-containing protein [Actinomycetota bacterium]